MRTCSIVVSFLIKLQVQGGKMTRIQVVMIIHSYWYQAKDWTCLGRLN